MLTFYADTTGTRNLREAVPHVPGPQPRGVVATAAELDALWRAADPLMRIWLRLTTGLCLRQSEVRILAPVHFHPESRTVSIPQPKTGHRKAMPIEDDIAALFAAAPDDPDPTTPLLTRYAGRTLSEAAIQHQWAKLKKKAAVRHEINPHDLRRTTATLGYNLTHDLRVVQQLLGHQRLGSTVSYIAPTNPDALRPILAQLWKPITEVKQ